MTRSGNLLRASVFGDSGVVEEMGTVSKPRLLDLFCGAGGAAVGYSRAGWEVVGVDVAPQPHYPFEFVQADALTVLRDGWVPGAGETRWRWTTASGITHFDAIHASPPCQRYVGWQNIGKARGGVNEWPDLIPATRALLVATGLPWVLENVENAPLDGVTLCGSMFGLGVVRHRIFESSELLMRGQPCLHTGDEVGVYGKLDGRRLMTRADGSELRNPSSLAEASTAMGIDWMVWDELREAIPPAYTQWVGERLLTALKAAA